MKKALFCLLLNVRRYTDGKRIKETMAKKLVNIDKEHPE